MMMTGLMCMRYGMENISCMRYGMENISADLLFWDTKEGTKPNET